MYSTSLAGCIFFFGKHTQTHFRKHTQTHHTHTHTHTSEVMTQRDALSPRPQRARDTTPEVMTQIDALSPLRTLSAKKKKSDNAGGNDADRCAKSEVTNCDRCAKSEDTNCSIHHLLHGQPLWGGMPADRVSKCVCIERV